MNLEKFLIGKRIVVSVPHFDDEIILAGGLLHKLSRKTSITVVCPNSEFFDTSKQLGDELGYEVLLSERIPEAEVLVTTHISDVILDHSQHCAKVLNEATMSEVCGEKLRPELLLMTLHPFFGTMVENCILPLSREDVKWKAEALKRFDVFERNISSIDVVKRTEWVEVVARFYGLKHNCGYAEVFELV